MNFYQHIFGAVALTLLLFNLRFLTPKDYQPLLFLLFFSVFPDLDHPKATVRRICDGFFLILFFLSLFLITSFSFGLQFFVFSCFYFFLTRFVFFKHRGLSHNLLFACVVCCFVAFLFGIKSGVCAFSGYLSHLLLDNALFKH